MTSRPKKKQTMKRKPRTHVRWAVFTKHGRLRCVEISKRNARLIQCVGFGDTISCVRITELLP